MYERERERKRERERERDGDGDGNQKSCKKLAKKQLLLGRLSVRY